MGFPFFKKKQPSPSHAPVKDRDVDASPLETREHEEAVERVMQLEKRADLVSSHAHEKRRFSVRCDQVLLRPVITESVRVSNYDQYFFEVALQANKVEIKKAFWKMYGIMPLSVRTDRKKGKPVTFGRIKGHRKQWKRAIITVPKGKSLELR